MTNVLWEIWQLFAYGVAYLFVGIRIGEVIGIHKRDKEVSDLRSKIVKLEMVGDGDDDDNT